MARPIDAGAVLPPSRSLVALRIFVLQWQIYRSPDKLKERHKSRMRAASGFEYPSTFLLLLIVENKKLVHITYENKFKLGQKTACRAKRTGYILDPRSTWKGEPNIQNRRGNTQTSACAIGHMLLRGVGEDWAWSLRKQSSRQVPTVCLHHQPL